MPKRVPLSADTLAYLREAVAQNKREEEMAGRVGCCVDTLKRILVRHNLRKYDGAKYEVRRDTEVKMWQRPCSGCKCSKPRPKWQFYCDPCQRARGMSGGDDPFDSGAARSARD